ncbi:MAG: hypothetical protein RXR32_03365 [Candidatus Micrarchaeota archaeon]
MKVSKKKPLRKASAKAQSAMEYLMTYGWAILIVAVVLGALYSLGVFDGAAFLGTSCIAASGFYCTNPTLSTGGVLTVTIGQATGTTFNNTYLYFVPSGANFSTSGHGISIGTLNSGQQVTVSIPLPTGSPYPAAYTLGTQISGYLYLQFTDIYGTTEVNKIATVLTKVTASSSSATFSQPTSIPSGIVAYVPITLTNSQSSATPSPFQQMIQINEGNYANYIAYNGNIANFEFFTQSGQILPAWIESNNSGTLTVWVKLPNGIPASASLTIYLGFASKTTNLLSSSGTSGIGEAPQLSSTYAQYDDGASVFNNYWNFAGTSTPSGINVYTSSGSVAFNNGVTIKGGTSTSGGENGVATSASFSAPIIVDYYGTQSTSPSGDSWGWNMAGFSNYLSGSDSDPAAGGTYTLINFEGSPGGKSTSTPNANPSTSQSGTITGGTLSTPSSNLFPNSVWTHIYTSSTYYTYQNYVNSTGYITGASNTASLPFEIEVGDNEASYCSSGMTVYWLRARAYPPNGVMPSVSFGGLSTA